MLTRPEMVATKAIDRAVPGSWPLYTKKEVQARAPMPQERTSYLCIVHNQSLRLIQSLIEQSRTLRSCRACKLSSQPAQRCRI